jgi:hypothetical protein
MAITPAGNVNNYYTRSLSGSPDTSSYTLLMWVQRKSGTLSDPQNLWTLSASSSSYIMVRVYAAGDNLKIMDPGIEIDSSFDLTLNTWQWLGIIKSGADISIYVDGSLVTSDTQSDSPISASLLSARPIWRRVFPSSMSMSWRI